MAHFDEKAGVVPCRTEWGTWHQTIEEVVMLVDVPAGTPSRAVKIDIKSDRLRCQVLGTGIDIEGKLFGTVLSDESLWTLEDNEIIRVTMIKTTRRPGNTWSSLLVDKYRANAAEFDSMEKKMTLERFARENPGFDFSGANIDGNYHGGGPMLPGDN